MATDLSAEACVERGVKLLDDDFPQWEKEVDLDELRVESLQHCILGQVYGYFSTGVQQLQDRHPEALDEQGFIPSYVYGWDASPENNFALLNDEWTRVITERRQLAVA